MANKGDDFYVQFGSNANEWATSIEVQLTRVQRKAKQTQDMLNSLDVHQLELLDGGGTGTGKRSRPGISAAGEGYLGDTVHQLAVAAEASTEIAVGIKGTVQAIEGIPAKITTAMQGVRRSIEGTMAQIRQEALGRGPAVSQGGRGFSDFQTRGTPGTVDLGSLWERAMRNSARTALLKGPGTTSSIAHVTAGQIDKAGVDRIVNAIEAQTKQLLARLGGPPGGGGSGSGRPSGTGGGAGGGVKAKADEVSKEVDASAEEVEAALTGLLQAVSGMGEVPAALKAQIAALEEAAAANKRRVERETLGITKAEQKRKAAADHAAQQRSREVISSVELAERERKQERVGSPLAPDFLERAGKRGKDSYSQADLEKMVEAYREAEIIVDRTGVKTKKQLAERLQAAGREYAATYGREGYGGFQTDRNKIAVQRSTEIPEALKEALGDLTPEIEETRRALEVLNKVGKGGGQIQREAARATTDLPGAINVPPGMVKGRRELGSGLGVVFSEEEYEQAVDSFRTKAEKAEKRSRELMATRPGFDPFEEQYDPSKIKDGQGEQERAIASATRKRIKEMRAYYTAVDDQALEYLGLDYALKQNTTKAKALRSNLLALEKVPNDQRTTAHRQEINATERDLAGVDEEIANIGKRMEKLPRSLRELVALETYREGLIKRRGADALDGVQSRTGKLGPAQSFYSQQGAGAAVEAEKRLAGEVAAAEKAIAEASDFLGKSTSDTPLAELDRAADKLDHATSNLARFSEELQLLRALIKENPETGKPQVAKEVEGRSSFQDYQARLEANAAVSARRTVHDRRLLETAAGERIAGLQGSVLSPKDLIKRYGPQLGFNQKTASFYASEDDPNKPGNKTLDPRLVKKVNSAYNDYVTALDHHLRNQTKEWADEEQKTAALSESLAQLETATNLFARRFSGANRGVGPSFSELSGYDPTDEKIQREEERRRARREQVFGDRDASVTKSGRPAAFAYQQDQEAVAGSTRRLKDAQDRQAAVAKKVAAAEEALERALKDRTPAERAAFAAAEAELQRVRQQQRELSNVALIGPKSGARTGADLEAAQAALAAAQSKRTIGGVDRVQALRSFLGGRDGAEAIVSKIAREIEDPISDAAEDLSRAEKNYRRTVAAEEAAVRGARASIKTAGGAEAPLSDVPDARREAEQVRTRLLAQERELLVKRAAILGSEEGGGVLDELKDLYGRRESIVGTVAAAREEGDLKENAGYHAAKDEQGRIEARIKQLENALGGGGLLGDFEDLSTEAATLAGEVKRLERESAEATKSLEKSASAWQKRKKQLQDERAALVGEGVYKGKDIKRLRDAPGQGAEYVAARDRARKIAEIDRELSAGKNRTLVETRAMTVAERDRGAALKAERATLQSLPHTKGAAKLARATGDDAGAAEILARANRLRAIRGELEGLGLRRASGSGGRGGAGGGGTVAGGGGVGGGGNANNLLRQILETLKAIHTTIRTGGVKVSRSAKPTPTTTAATATTAASSPRTFAVGSNGVAEDVTAAIVAQAAEEAKKNRTKPARPAAGVVAAKADEKALAAERERIRNAETLARAQGNVSASTLREVAVLKSLEAQTKQLRTVEDQLAHQSAVKAQQQRALLAIQGDLLETEANGNDRRATAKTLLRDAQPSLTGSEFDSIARSAKSEAGGTFTKAGEESGDEFGVGFGNGVGGFFKGGFWKRVVASTGTFIVRNFTAGAVFGLTNYFQQVMEQAIQTEATFVRVSSALEATGQDVGNIRSDLAGISTDYGVQLNDVYETAAGLAGLFSNAEDLAGATRIVAQLQTISGGALNAQEAMGVLASTLSAFEQLPGEDLSEKLLPGGIEGMTKVADVLTVVQNNLGTNVETTAEGVSRMAGLARQMKLSFEQTAVFTAQIAKQTNQTGAAAGEQFSRILGALQTGRGRGAVLQEYGENSPVSAALAQGDYGKVLEEMIRGWDGLSDSQRRNVAVSVAGQRQAAAFNALMNNGTKTLNVLAKAENANGEAADRMQKLMDTLNKRLDVFTTQIQNLASGLVRTGLLNFLGLVLLGANEVLGVVNDILTLFNKFADDNAFLGFLRDSIGLLLGAGVAIKALQYGAAGLKGALAGSAVASGARAGLAESRAAQAARASEFGPSRPGYGEYAGRRGFIARPVGFAADRTVGVGVDATGRGLTNLGNRLNVATKEVDGAAVATSRFRRSLGQGLQAAGAGTGFLAGGLRDTLQGRPRTRTGRQNFLDRAEAYSTQASYLRQGAATRGYSAEQEADVNRQARNADRMARINRAGAASVGRVSDGMSKLASSGVLADAALIGLTIGITAFIEGMNEQNEALKNAKVGGENLKRAATDERYKTQEARDLEAYAGPTSDAYLKKLKDYEAKSDSKWTSTWTTIKADLQGGPKGWQALVQTVTPGTQAQGMEESQRQLRRYLGYDDEGNGTFGTSTANGLIDNYRKSLEKYDGKTGSSVSSAILDAQKDYSKKIASEVDNILEDDDLSKAQKEAAIANLEIASKIIGDMTEDATAIADNIGATIALSADQIKKVQETVAAVQSTNGLRSIQGFDLTPLYNELIKDTGAQEGSRTSDLLKYITSGNADPVDQAVANITLLRDEVSQLYTSWQSKLAQGLPDEADEVRGQLLSTLAQLGQSEDQAIQGVLDQANMLATQARAEGDYVGAAKIMTDAQKRVRDIMQASTDQQLDMLEESQKTQNDLYQFATALDNLLPGNPFSDALPKALGAVGDKIKGAYEDLVPENVRDKIGGFISGLTPQPGTINPVNDRPTPIVPGVTPGLDPNKAQNYQDTANNQRIIANIQAATQGYIEQQTNPLKVAAAKEMDPKVKARIERRIAKLTLAILSRVDQGLAIPGVSEDDAAALGDASVDQNAITDAQVNYYNSAVGMVQSQHDFAMQAAQQAADLRQAQLGVQSAIANARGDAVQAARVQVQVARAQMSLAKQQLALAKTPAEVNAAKVAMLNAQAALIAASASVDQAQQDLIQSRFQVAIALAESAGHTVAAARKTLQAARQALQAALKKSGGEATAEVNAARVQAIQAEAALRDAKLQDALDTINFNLEMGKITQASAIQALQEILKTSDLTKAQRRQLLLQIKGMKDELANSQFNFGNIKLPTPYQMRRYIQERRQQYVDDLNSASGVDGAARSGAGPAGGAGSTTTNYYEFKIDGADTAKVRKVIEEVVGKSGGTLTKTTGARRGR